MLNYHSVTPPGFFAPWNNGIAQLQVATLAELAMVAPRAALGVAVSRFDEVELRGAGCTRTTVIPVANLAVPPTEPDPVVLARLETARHRRRRTSPPGSSWLSVGRLAPNKGHHETVAALFVARRTVDPGRPPDGGGLPVGARLRRGPPAVRGHTGTRRTPSSS